VNCESLTCSQEEKGRERGNNDRERDRDNMRVKVREEQRPRGILKEARRHKDTGRRPKGIKVDDLSLKENEPKKLWIIREEQEN
jgi:hypothetical protein